jgi:hypothetical protein
MYIRLRPYNITFTQLVPKGAQNSQKNNAKGNRAAHFPEIRHRCRGVDDALEVHAVVAGEKRERQKDDSDAGENQDCFVLDICYNSQLILFDGTQLEELCLIGVSFTIVS